jgi:hypothetical protein
MRAPDSLDDVRRMIDELGLTALGYEVQIELSVDGGRVLVTLRHPLRGNSDWGWASLDLEPASLEQLAAKVTEWPDTHVACAARTVRPEALGLRQAVPKRTFALAHVAGELPTELRRGLRERRGTGWAARSNGPPLTTLRSRTVSVIRGGGWRTRTHSVATMAPAVSVAVSSLSRAFALDGGPA